MENKQKVLIIDDNAENIKIAANFIKNSELIIWTAMNGKTGIELAKAKHPDIILLDIQMPEMDGFETAEEIRKSDTDVSIVFCTSYYTITNAGKGFEVAAEDFLSKPLLYRKVENILNKIYKKKLLNAEEKLFLKCHDGLITLQLSDIIYIQTENKLLILHTIHGDVQSSQRMNELEKRLSTKQFYRCHNSYMVNFDYVEGVKQDSVLIKDKAQKLKTIPISKYKKEEFMRALARYVGKWEN